MADQPKVDMYMVANQKYFPEDKRPIIRDRLLAMDDNQFINMSMLELKDPTILLVVSIFLGTLGIDRFLVGDIGMGILKLLTAGCCGILTIIDWFCIQKRTRELNFNKVMGFLF